MPLPPLPQPGPNDVWGVQLNAYLNALADQSDDVAQLVDAKGDLIVGTANDTPARRPVGADGSLLKANSNDATGLDWLTTPELARNLFRWPSPHKRADKWVGQWGAPVVLADGLRYTAPAAPGSYPTYPMPEGSMGTLPSGTLVTMRVAVAIPAGRTAAMRLYSRGTDNVDNGSGETAFIGTGQRQLVTVRHTLPADGFAYPTLYINAPQAGDVVESGPLSITTTGVVHPFDGDTPGARWLGAPNASESVKMLHGPEDHALLTWLDAGRAQGVGSPEGKVTAPVGAEYKDTVATNGAVKWIKATGTSNTGWRVAYGDTGWRALPLLNGWTGTVVLRRVGQSVSWGAEPVGGGAATADEMVEIPLGFQHRSIASVRAPDGAGNNINVRNGFLDTGSRSGFYATMDWVTDQAWPTVLPGTPT